MRELGGSLFAVEGEVDKYFPKGVKSIPFEHNPEEVKRLIDAEISEVMKAWWIESCTPELVHKRLVARNPKMDTESLRDIQARIEQHIQSAPEREAAALREWRVKTHVIAYPNGVVMGFERSKE
jgi:hypothetical protein